MGDGVTYALMVAFGFVLLPLLLTRGLVVLLGPDGLLARICDRLPSLDPYADDDPDQAAFRAEQRYVELGRNLDRLRRLLVCDDVMSATRQLGNRLAFRQLQDELRHRPIWLLPATLPPAPIREPYRRAAAPQVEVLDVGWRR